MWFLARSVKADAIGESSFDLLLLLILPDYSIEIKHGHFVDIFVLCLQPRLEAWTREVSVIFGTCLQISLLRFGMALMTIVERQHAVFVVNRRLIKWHCMALLVNPLHLLNRPICIVHLIDRLDFALFFPGDLFDGYLSCNFLVLTILNASLFRLQHFLLQIEIAKASSNDVRGRTQLFNSDVTTSGLD